MQGINVSRAEIDLFTLQRSSRNPAASLAPGWPLGEMEQTFFFYTTQMKSSSTWHRFLRVNVSPGYASRPLHRRVHFSTSFFEFWSCIVYGAEAEAEVTGQLTIACIFIRKKKIKDLFLFKGRSSDSLELVDLINGDAPRSAQLLSIVRVRLEQNFRSEIIPKRFYIYTYL